MRLAFIHRLRILILEVIGKKQVKMVDKYIMVDFILNGLVRLKHLIMLFSGGKMLGETDII